MVFKSIAPKRPAYFVDRGYEEVADEENLDPV